MTHVPDWLAAVAIVVPAFTALTGYWLAGRNEEARDQRTARREAAARRVSLAERLDHQRHEFQLELLLQLQDVLHRNVRATAQMLLHDRQTLRDQGTLTGLPADINEEAFAAGIALSRLQVRVLDDGLRQEIAAFHKFNSDLTVRSVVLLNSMAAPEAIERIGGLLNEITARYVAVTEALGVLLRGELGRTVEDLPIGDGG